MLIIKQLSYIYIIFCIIHIILCINGYPLTRIAKNLQKYVELEEKNNSCEEGTEKLKECIYDINIMRSHNNYISTNIIIMCLPIFHIIVIVTELFIKWILYKWNH